MLLRNLASRFLRYNLWANQRLADWLKSIDRTLLYKETGSSFGTIDRTLQHILAAQIYWHSIIVKEHIPAFDQPERVQAADEVLAHLVTTAQQLVDDISVFDEQQLIKPIRASDSTQSRYEYILHVVNHSAYHRGQVVTLGRALGVTGEIPVTDYDAYLWWIENRA